MPASGTNSPTAGTAPSSAADGVRLAGVSFAYGPTVVVRDLSLAVPAGAFCALLGPSGCGKTTLLKLIAGELAPQSGRVSVNGRDVTTAPPEARNIGTVYQSYALFPHLTAWKNVAFGLEVRGVAKATVAERVEALLHRVRLTSDEWHRRPAQLSGGQQQRVALARALAFGPDLLLLDEPLANLDRQLREELQAELRRVHAESETTTILVTHDQEEALAAADLIGVMHAGRLLQIGPPREVYDRPRTPFVARFLGDANLLDGGRVGRTPGRLVLVRPERCVIDGPADHRWTARVESVADYGADVVVRVTCDPPPADGSAVADLPGKGGGEEGGRLSSHASLQPDRLFTSPLAGEVARPEVGRVGGEHANPHLIVRARSNSFRIGQAITVGFPDSAVWEIPES